MHEELEQVLKNKHMSLPIHRGEYPIQQPVVGQVPSFFHQTLHAPVPTSIALAFIIFMAASVISLTFHLGPELDVSAAVEVPATIANRSIHQAVLGTLQSRAPQASIAVNGVDGVVAIAKGGTIEVAWTTEGVHDCLVTPMQVKQESGRGIIENIIEPQTFTLICNAYQGGVVADSVKVIVE
jgi:hypothetical protein